MRRTYLAAGLLVAVLMVLPPVWAQPDQPEPQPSPAAGTAPADHGGTVASGEPSPTSGGQESVQGATDTHREDHGGGHANPVTPVLLALVVMLTGAKLFGEVFERLSQPAVLGELIFGVILGNLALVGFSGLSFISSSAGVVVLAEIGVILLLFEVGLESNVREMLSVGPSSLLVAILGVVAPFLLGWGLSAILLPDLQTLVHVFIGATLCATSVGITARVLADLGKLQSRETKVILGAAVIDDVLGLVILAVVQGAIIAVDTGQKLEPLSIIWIISKALLFLFGAVVVGSWLSPRLFGLANKLRVKGVLLAVCLVFCFLLAYLANLIDLAPIVGAFAAGLILDEVHYRGLLKREGEHQVEELLHPINSFLVPIFFVLMGTRVDLKAFGDSSILGFALLISLVAVIGKMVCVLGVLEKGLDRLSIAVGMVPRGEVGLIFVNVGAGLTLFGKPVINNSILSAVVIMVILTTLMTPPALKATLSRRDRREAKAKQE